MTTLTCGQCRQTFDTTESHACPVVSSFTHHPKPNSATIATRPISVAAAEHLATVEAERDALIEEVTGLEWSLNRLTIAAVDAIRFLGGDVDPDDEYGLPGALIAAADLLGEPSLEPGSNP